MLRHFTWKAVALVVLAGSAHAGGTPIGGGPVFVPNNHVPQNPNGIVFTREGSYSSGVAGGAAAGGAVLLGNPVLAPGQEQGGWAAQQLRNASAWCAALADSTYQIDCLADRISQIAGQMSTSGGYAQTKAQLEKTAAELRATAQRYRDTDRQPRRFASAEGARNPQSTTRPIQPIRPGSRSAAVAEADRIIAEAETVLLRSSRDNPSVAPQITRIAAAVGSNKVLLRST